MTKVEWNDELVNKLFAMAAEGHSFSVIGAAIGCSRNACIGKYNRVRVARGIHTRKPRPKIIGSRKLAPSLPKNAPQVAPRVALPPLRVAVYRFPPPRPSQGVGILDVTGCRFAVADDESLVGRVAFCNEAIAGHGSYCSYHASIVYTKAPKPGTAKRFTVPTSLLRMGVR